MQPAGAAVAIVGLSADGRYVANAVERVVRIAAVEDGRVLAEVTADGVVTAIAFAPDGTSIAVGDGNRGLCNWAARRRPRARHCAARCRDDVAGLHARRHSAGRCRCGRLDHVDRPAAGAVEGSARHWSQPIRWLEFSPDGSALFVATDAWLHALAAATPTLAPVHSRLVVWPAATPCDGDFRYGNRLRRCRRRRLVALERARSRGGERGCGRSCGARRARLGRSFRAAA